MHSNKTTEGKQQRQKRGEGDSPELDNMKKPGKLIFLKKCQPLHKCPPFYPASHKKTFLITAEKGRKEAAMAENWKRQLSKSE